MTKRNILVVLCFAVAAFFSSQAEAASMEEVSQLLQQVEANAYDIRHHAATVKTYNRFPTQYSWQTHTFHAESMSNRVNDIGDLLGKLKTMKDVATQRQNKAINLVIPDAAKLADLTAKAVRIINEKKTELEVGPPEYSKTIDEIYELADNVVAAVSLAESWSEIRALRKEATSK